MSSLPINAALPALLKALQERDEVVLQAPPGAGKTTRVPLALLDESWLQGQTIIMLEPRRLAARAAAERMAGELGEKVGETVGYCTRAVTYCYWYVSWDEKVPASEKASRYIKRDQSYWNVVTPRPARASDGIKRKARKGR